MATGKTHALKTETTNSVFSIWTLTYNYKSGEQSCPHSSSEGWWLPGLSAWRGDHESRPEPGNTEIESE